MMMENLDFILGVFRVISRMGFGLFFVIQGLNGFISIFKIPEPSVKLGQFLDQWSKVPSLMTMTKVSQFIFGAGLASGYFIGLSLCFFGALCYGICLLQWSLNHNKKLAIGLASFYLVTLLLHLNEVWAILN